MLDRAVMLSLTSAGNCGGAGTDVKVARLHAPGDVRLHDEDRPEAGDVDMRLVEVTSVGLCGSDLHWFTEGSIGDAVLARPLVLGHEMAGVVRGGPDDGRRVAVDPAISCEIGRAHV